MTSSLFPLADVGGYNVTSTPTDPEPPDPGLAAWDVAGLWAKIESYQQVSAAHFPATYNPTLGSHATSVFGELDRYIWFRGIQYTLQMGLIDNGNANPNLWNWTAPDNVMETIRDLFTISGRNSGKNKKVIFLLPHKAFSEAGLEDILPDDMKTFTGTYPNGKKRYHYAMGFLSGAAGNVVNGYMLRLQDFNNGLTGLDKAGQPIYTLRDRYYKFVQAIHDRYASNPAFGGTCNAEGEPNQESNYYDASEFDRTTWFTGRFKMLQKLKTIFTKHLVADAISLHDDAYLIPTQQDWQTLKQYGISFINPNFHTGLNLSAIYKAADELDGFVPTLHSCQGLDMSSRTGFTKRNGPNNDVYNFQPNPPNYGQPRTSMENPIYDANGVRIAYDPPDLNWIINRAIYLKANMLHLQRNLGTTGIQGAPIFNWPDIVAAMQNNTTIMSPNTGGLIQNDPAGGMNITRPLKIAGD